MFPYYLNFGMNYDQYWHGDPWMVIGYRKASRMKREEENFSAWINGIYTLKAFETVMANAFSKKGSQPVPYLDKPIDLFNTGNEEEEKKKKEQEAIAKMFDAWGKRWNATHAK